MELQKQYRDDFLLTKYNYLCKTPQSLSGLPPQKKTHCRSLNLSCAPPPPSYFL